MKTCYQCEQPASELNSRSRCVDCQSATDKVNYTYYKRQLWALIKDIEDISKALMAVTDWMISHSDENQQERAVISRIAQDATDYLCSK